jgi:Domain of unknown function (DUF1707)
VTNREAAAAALGEHFAQGRLTLDELVTRLDATLAATTHGELTEVVRDLPGLAVFSAQISLPRGKRVRPGGKFSQARAQEPWQRHHGWTRPRS